MDGLRTIRSVAFVTSMASLVVLARCRLTRRTLFEAEKTFFFVCMERGYLVQTSVARSGSTASRDVEPVIATPVA